MYPQVENIEYSGTPSRPDMDHARFSQCMADSQLIEYIGIIDAQIGHAAVSQEQFPEQIDLKIFMESVLAPAASFKACVRVRAGSSGCKLH